MKEPDLKIIVSFIRNYKTLYDIKRYLDLGYSDYQIRQNLKGVFYLERYIEIARKLDKNRIINSMDKLYEIEYTIKNTNLDFYMQVEKFILLQ